MKNLILLGLIILAPFILNAQLTITWKGGTSGKETVWSEARNWDANRIPNENDKVIIKMENNGHFAQPIINSKVNIAWLEIQDGAELTILTSGTLIIDGTHAYSEGISIYGGAIKSTGEILLKNIDQAFIAELSPSLLDKDIHYFSELHNYAFYVVSSDFDK